LPFTRVAELVEHVREARPVSLTTHSTFDLRAVLGFGEVRQEALEAVRLWRAVSDGGTAGEFAVTFDEQREDLCGGATHFWIIEACRAVVQGHRYTPNVVCRPEFTVSAASSYFS
jgi:hypothetical protein